ncbi:MAG TPA: carboxypeptidase regulatory-like domain-containing protein, partial [Candidatus Angelobacter sp.]|nr:carboxypeptidase regulatory-like domain-containing protein [Candidatus Angelobacter sp.]
GTRLSIYASENPELSQRVVADTTGRFTFSTVPAGKYTLLGSGQGYRSQGYHQHGEYFIGIAVGSDLDSEHITFRLVADARIEGIVVDDDGEPIRNANVQLYQRGHETGRQSTRQITGSVTDDRGHYVFSHLAPGTYYVAVSARPWYAQYPNPGEPVPDGENGARIAEERAPLDVAYPLTFYPSAEDSAAGTPIVLHPGDSVNADITMHAVPAVHLRVRSGEPHEPHSEGISTRGFPRVSQRIFEGTLVPVLSSQGFNAAGGVYEYTGIAPGHYVIEIAGGGGKQSGWYREMDLSGTVEIDARENPPLASVTGTLALEGTPRPAGKIFVILANRLTSETSAAEVTPKGTFDFSEMEVRPGRYDVVLNIAEGFQIANIAARGARVTGKTLEISGGSVQLALTATRVLARVNGVVVRDEKPWPGAMVVLVPRNPVADFTLFRRDESDSDGTFSLRDVLPGAYAVIALENGWELDWANPATLQPYLKQGVEIDVSGEVKLSVKVTLQ